MISSVFSPNDLLRAFSRLDRAQEFLNGCKAPALVPKAYWLAAAFPDFDLKPTFLKWTSHLDIFSGIFFDRTFWDCAV